MKNRIFILRSGSTVSLSINGETRQFIHESESAAKADFVGLQTLKSECQSSDASVADEAFKQLQSRLDPNFRLNDVGGLTRDSSGTYYLGNYNEPVPAGLLTKIKEYVEDGLDLTPLINFWKLLMLNPNKGVRDSLFRFAERFSFPITDMGYFIAYKSVAWAGQKHKELGMFIAQKYVYAKAENKDPDFMLVYQHLTDDGTETGRYFIIDAAVDSVTEELEEEWLTEHEWQIEEYVSPYEYAKLTTEEQSKLCLVNQSHYTRRVTKRHNINQVGVLGFLFTDMDTLFDFDKPTFTDWHTRKSTIVLGTAQTLTWDECDTDENVTCSRGLHVGAPGYVGGFGGSDKHILACLVNPMNVAACPLDYNGEKLRCREYLPYAICELNDDSTIREIDTRYFEEDYVSIEAEELKILLSGLLTKDMELLADGGEAANEQTVQLIRDRLVVIK